MPLFTIIMDYDGGIYISQHRGDSPGNALKTWSKSLNTDTIQNFGPKSREALLNELLDCNHELVPLNGMLNAWCTSLVVRDKLILLNIVKTDSRTKDNKNS